MGLVVEIGSLWRRRAKVCSAGNYFRHLKGNFVTIFGLHLPKLVSLCLLSFDRHAVSPSIDRERLEILWWPLHSAIALVGPFYSKPDSPELHQVMGLAKQSSPAAAA